MTNEPTPQPLTNLDIMLNQVKYDCKTDLEKETLANALTELASLRKDRERVDVIEEWEKREDCLPTFHLYAGDIGTKVPEEYRDKWAYCLIEPTHIGMEDWSKPFDTFRAAIDSAIKAEGK